MAVFPKKILLVDDEQYFRDIFSVKLKRAGFDVITAQDGREALSILRNLRPHLVLLDVRMPKMDGVETLDNIRKDPELGKLRVVFLTNYGEPEGDLAFIDEKFAKEMGSYDYIRKTEDLEHVVDRVKRYF